MNFLGAHSVQQFVAQDPHLRALSALKYQYRSTWWQALNLTIPGVYILTGGRQVGKSTSCKLLIQHCLEAQHFSSQSIYYLSCDEIFDATTFSQKLRTFLDAQDLKPFLCIIDEVTYVPHWDRVIKALADEGRFTQGICILTGSDTLILKEAAMRFPGRRGIADQTDFHVYPLTFREYVQLIHAVEGEGMKPLSEHFQNYLICGGYLRAINDLAAQGKIQPATFLTYEQWVRGDFLKQNRQEYLLKNVVRALIKNGVSQVSYSTLTDNAGDISKETCIQYCTLLERMDILFDLQAFDHNTRQGFPKKARKFHFVDPFIFETLTRWLHRENILTGEFPVAYRVESCVASHCYRYSLGNAFYFKGQQGEVDVIFLKDQQVFAVEVKWSGQVRPNDSKALTQFKNAKILNRQASPGIFQGVQIQPVWEFLYGLV